MILRSIASVVLNVAIFGILLFVPAGTLEWCRGWAFLGVVFFAAVFAVVLVFPGNEGLIEERFKLPIQRGQPLADKILLILFLAGFLGVVVLVPLDVFHYHWMTGPGAAVSTSGLVLFVFGWAILALAMRENAFAAPVVKHQPERGQRVIDTGVYGIVRHPMYAGGALLLVGLPLFLQSYIATLAAIVPIAVLGLRIVVEERFLARELSGYDDYTRRVRYRLVPYLW